VQRRESQRTVDDEGAIARLPSSDDASRVAESQWSDTVRNALAELPEYNREIFLLHYIEGFSYDEIERMTGVRQSALKMRVKRASDALRARLASWVARQ
jgi:RNA polymerase sigma-70 factor (ECF subfamily)